MINYNFTMKKSPHLENNSYLHHQKQQPALCITSQLQGFSKKICLYYYMFQTLCFMFIGYDDN
jgi:hypothetical protein